MLNSLFNNKIIIFLSKRVWLLVFVWIVIGLSVYIPLFYNKEHSIIGSLLLVGIIPIFLGWLLFLLYMPYKIIRYFLTTKLIDLKEDMTVFFIGLVKMVLCVIIGTLFIYLFIFILRVLLNINGAD